MRGIDEEEIIAGLSEMKNHKTAGKGNITKKIIIEGWEEIIKIQ